MTGKEKCEYLKKVRAEFARISGSDFTPAVCTHQGECTGLCPACDREAEELLRHFNIQNSKVYSCPSPAPTVQACRVSDNMYTIPDDEDVGLPF